MVSINEIKFGSITIEGRKYRHDVVVLPNGEVKRRKGGVLMFGGHTFARGEIERLKEAGAVKIIIGTGINGAARIAEESRRYAEESKIELIEDLSEKAVNKFNHAVSGDRNVGAIIHVTC